ncbi:MAG: DUF4139 domain-containing protein [Planctomycetes bacterium]|nr:DUF4139 domain-containing protein [Planctomycetota bacterium]MCW8134076.1 DUF4139 domain-containing protein [Planctomycetota bacterium]
MKYATIIFALLLAAPLVAKEELVTLPSRDSVQLTIYNSEDLTLVREVRTLSFRQGNNRLQFSWANTLIDPTSVEFMPVGAEAAKELELLDTSFPAQGHEMLIWTVACTKAAAYKVEISYFTSGISWSAEYHGVVAPDERSMELTAFVTVHNNSGEDYEDAQVRLVVGTINLVEKIIDLATPPQPGGGGARRPGPPLPPSAARRAAGPQDDADAEENEDGMRRPKEIEKVGLSEYYIYTVEGRETVPNRWSKRLKSFTVAGVPLKTVYRYEPAKFGWEFTKVLEFKNDEDHKLGKEPLPNGIVRLYKDAGGGRLSWMGALASKYIPKKDEVKVNVGADPECTMKLKRTRTQKKDLTFNQRWLQGWTQVDTYELELRNFRDREVEVEVHQAFGGDFDFSGEGWERHDAQTHKWKLTLKAAETRKASYSVTTRMGTNARK